MAYPTGYQELGNAPVVTYDEIFRRIIQEAGGIKARIQDDPIQPDTNGESLVYYDRVIRPTYTSLSAAATVGATTLSVTSEAGFFVNDLIQAENSAEVIRVSAVAAGSLTVSRGFGGSTAEAIANGARLNRIERANLEGDAGYDTATNPATPRTNEFWRAHVVYGVTGDNEATAHHGGLPAGTKLAFEQREALIRVMYGFERMLLYGVQQRATKAQGGSFQGLLQSIGLHSAGAAVQSAVGAITSNKLTQSVERIAARGGNPNAIYLHPTLIGPLVDELSANLTVDTSSDTLGLVVRRFVAETGHVLALVPDRSINPQHVVILDETMPTLVWKRRIAVTDLAQDANDQRRQKLNFQVSLQYPNAGETAEWLKGVTPA